MATDLTKECREGYDNLHGKNPYMHSSSCWMAFAAGQKLGGISGVKSCHQSRGYSVRVTSDAGTEFRVTFSGPELDHVTVDRGRG